MIPALTIEQIKRYCSNRYDYGEKRIVGIMLARYSIPQSEAMIKQQYDFWHTKTDRYLDIYWLGYGAYAFPGEPGQYYVGDYGDESSVYFDTKVFAHGVQKLEQFQEIHDEIGILLCIYYNGNIYLNESVFFNLENLMNDKNKNLREFANYLIELCKQEYDVAKVTVKLKARYRSLRGVPTRIAQTAIRLIEVASPFL